MLSLACDETEDSVIQSEKKRKKFWKENAVSKAILKAKRMLELSVSRDATTSNMTTTLSSLSKSRSWDVETTLLRDTTVPEILLSDHYGNLCSVLFIRWNDWNESTIRIQELHCDKDNDWTEGPAMTLELDEKTLGVSDGVWLVDCHPVHESAALLRVLPQGNNESPRYMHVIPTNCKGGGQVVAVTALAGGGPPNYDWYTPTEVVDRDAVSKELVCSVWIPVELTGVVHRYSWPQLEPLAHLDIRFTSVKVPALVRTSERFVAIRDEADKAVQVFRRHVRTFGHLEVEVFQPVRRIVQALDFNFDFSGRLFVQHHRNRILLISVFSKQKMERLVSKPSSAHMLKGALAAMQFHRDQHGNLFVLEMQKEPDFWCIYDAQLLYQKLTDDNFEYLQQQLHVRSPNLDLFWEHSFF